MRNASLSLLPAALGLFLLTSAPAQICLEACDVDPGPASSSPRGLACAFGNLLVFSAATAATGQELHTYDLATRRCQLIEDLRPGPGGSNPAQFTVCGDRVYFSAVGFSGDELYEWDGQAVRLHDIRIGPGGSSPRWLTSCNNRLFFTATDAAVGMEVWVADPVSGVVQPVRDIAPGPAFSAPSFLACAGDRLRFRATDGVHGAELWETDGTPAGTRMVADINPGPADSDLGFMTFCPDAAGRFRLLLAADDGVFGNELYQYDGNRVTLVSDILPGAGSSLPMLGASRDGRVFFSAVSATGREPWVTDGTAAGTFALGDLNPGGNPSDPNVFTLADGQLFFTAMSAATGIELYRTDGTIAGTGLVRDIRAGAGWSSPRWLTAVGDRVYFAADDGIRGLELWVSDGTSNGTRIVADILPGAGPSNPSAIVRAGGALFFAADGGRNGAELWTTRNPGAMVERVGQGSGGAELDASRAPRLGSQLSLVGRNAPRGQVGVTFLTTLPAVGGPIHIPQILDRGAWAWLDILGTAAFSNAQQWQSPPIRVPNQAELRGGSLLFQTLYIDLAVPFPVRTSNGLLLTVGD